MNYCRFYLHCVCTVSDDSESTDLYNVVGDFLFFFSHR